MFKVMLMMSIKSKRKFITRKRVLFGGCPCQVAALYKFLGDSGTQNLYTMDIVCHGVPSPKVLRKYLKENFADKKLVKLIFEIKQYMDGVAKQIFILKMELSIGVCIQRIHFGKLFAMYLFEKIMFKL